jgi:hypothetical protein
VIGRATLEQLPRGVVVGALRELHVNGQGRAIAACFLRALP